MLNISPAVNVIGRLYQEGNLLSLNATLISTNFHISSVLMSPHDIKSLPPNSTCFVIYFVVVLLLIVLPNIGIRYYSSVIVCHLFKISYQIPLSSFCILLDVFLVIKLFFPTTYPFKLPLHRILLTLCNGTSVAILFLTFNWRAFNSVLDFFFVSKTLIISVC